MARVNQNIKDIKHLILLRRAVLRKKSVEIYSREPSMRLTVSEGLFHGGDCVDTVRTMIEKPVPHFDWEELERKAWFILQNPSEIFSKAIGHMTPNNARMITYVRTFSKLPRVRMRSNATFHTDNIMQVEYQRLYRLSLTDQGASVGDYLADSEGLEQLRRRIGIVIACYCLGDFTSAEYSGSKSKKAGVVRRIMARLRKL